MKHVRFGICLAAFLILSGTAAVCGCRAESRDALPECSYGLTFRSHTYSIDERTSLCLTPERPLNLRHGFRLDFDLCLNHEDSAYGYVMRLISGSSSALDINANINAGNLNFVLVRDGETVENVQCHDWLRLEAGKWMHVSVSSDGEKTVCSVDRSMSRVMDRALADLSKVEIWFGACGDDSFHSTDVAPMTIRDIRISAPGGPVREWKLCRNNGTKVYDEVRGAPARVENGIWEIDRHTGWTGIWSGTFSSQPELAYDRESGHVFAASDDIVVDRSLVDGTERRVPVKSGRPFVCGGSQMIYDPASQRLLSYSMQFREFTFFDFRSGCWSSSRRENVPMNQQHSRWFDPPTRMLYVFGGYGNHIYSSGFFVRNIDSLQWRRSDLSFAIEPRYLAAMGPADGRKLLVMGGYGNRSGRQEESPKNIYDINCIDMDTGRADSLSTFTLPDERWSMASTLVYDSRDSRIWTLAFDNGRSSSALRLLSVPAGGGEAEFFGDPVPFTFHDIESYTELSFSPDSSSLYAIVSNARNSLGGGYGVEVYEMAYPPIPEQLVRQMEGGGKRFPAVPVIVSVAALVAAAACALLLRRRARRPGPAQASAPETASGPEAAQAPDDRAVQKADTYVPKPEEVKSAPSSISLLGGLSVVDADGNNVTTGFTPVVRQLLLLILMNSGAKSAGITSEVLDETLWYGMERRQAANNRNVNIRKLRLKLDKVWDVELENRNGYWFFDIRDLACCDYLEVRQLLREVLASPGDRERLNRLLLLILKGPLLPDNDFEWLDDYKGRYTNVVIDALTKIQHFYEDDPEMSIMIARAMRVQDIIDEEAVRIYCRALYLKGNRSLSRTVWDKFTEDYRKSMGTLPDFSWSSIVGDK